jgi:large subunit ribosomal protein L21
MQAVVKTGGKQYIVKPGDVINVEKLDGNAGDTVEFGEILMVSDSQGKVEVGSPLVENTRVMGKILYHKKGDKVIVFKFKRRKGYRRKKGHRQIYTYVQITDIGKRGGD